MKVFVAYGFDERDRWVHDHVIPLVEAFGAQPVTGEWMPGEELSAGVRARIQAADALIGFLTSRGEDIGVTHRWVIEELAVAASKNKKVVEVREADLTRQGGMLGALQHLNYTPGEELACLVQVARVLGEWSRELTVKGYLLPQDLADKIRRALNRPGFACTYTVWDGPVQSEPQPAKLVPRPGGLELYASGIPETAAISVRVVVDGKPYESAAMGVRELQLMLLETA